MNIPYVNLATIRRLFLTFASVLWVVAVPAGAEGPAPYKPPQFRAVEKLGKPPEIESAGTIQLLADADFAPFSFASGQGTPAGLAVELALAACAEVKLACNVTLKPYAELLPALAAHQGDVVLTGPRIDETALAAAEATRPYFRTLARFAVPSGSPLAAADVASLKGKRIAVVAGTAHEAWLKAYFTGSTVQPFPAEAEAQQALRSGNVDVLFGDNLHVIYWVSGEASNACCKVLDHAFSDLGFFSRNLAFFVRSDRADLRAALDYGLDRLQLNGTTEKILNRYIPLNPW
jgi:polar amino acid transport system substrate-binding protein